MRHTSASLLIQENADPDVREDLERFFARLVRDTSAVEWPGAPRAVDDCTFAAPP